MAMQFSSTSGSPKNTMRLRLVIVVLVIVTFGTAGLTVYKHYATQRSASSLFVKQIIEKAEINFTAFFRPITINLDLMRKWGQSGLLNTSDPKSLNDKLVPILQAIPHIYSIVIATDSALEYAIVRDPKGWRIRVPVLGDNDETLAYWHVLDSEGALLDKWKDDEALLPMRKMWFRGAVAANMEEYYWTAAHALYPDSRIGVTATTQWVREGIKYVAAISILIEDVRSTFNAVRVDNSAKFFLYANERVIFDLDRSESSYTATARNVPELFRTDGTDDLFIKEAVDEWLSATDQDEPFKLYHEKIPWWVFVIGLTEGQRDVAIGILVPERVLLSQQDTEDYLFVVVALGIMWVGFFWYMKTHARGASISAQDDALLDGTEEALLQAVRQGESERLEFKATLRWNIEANKPGKEIELAVLKTVAAFLNTDGGALVVGVDDDGTLTGIDNDGFPSDDRFLLHFTNMFDQYIGPEFSEYIRFGIKAVGGRKVLVVVCREAPKPVFVRDRDQDKFFIRSGPSSRQLTTSQVLEYVKNKGKQLS